MISLPLPFTDDDLAAQIRPTIAAAALNGAEAYIRVLVTRGVGELTCDPAATPQPSLVVIVKPQVDVRHLPASRAASAGPHATVVSIAGQEQNRFRSPYGLSMRPTGGQNLFARTNGSGKAASSRE